MNIILCGLPCVGKTTYGKLISKKFNLNFVDTDILLENTYEEENKEKKSCKQIFFEEKEKKFRELEMKAIKTLINKKNSVIALGGGALYFSEIFTFLKSLGKIIYLKHQENVLIKRLLRKKTLKNVQTYFDYNDPVKSFKNICKNRISKYESLSDIQIDLSLTTDEEIYKTIKDNI